MSFTGFVEFRELLLIPAPMEGTLDLVAAEPGEQVFEGQLLARIRNEAVEASSQQAREQMNAAESRVHNMESLLLAARLEASRADADASRAWAENDRTERLFTRQQMLLREGATARRQFEKSQKDYELARTEYSALAEIARQANERVKKLTEDLDAARRALDEHMRELEAAEADLRTADIVAPADGVLAGSRVAAGEQVNAAVHDLIQLATQPTLLKVTIEPKPDVLARLRQGLPALVVLAELPAGHAEGEVTEIKDGKAIVEFESPEPVWKPSLTATVQLKLP
jgi:multidrug resistance efflux pump